MLTCFVVLHVGIIERLKTVFNVLLLNTGLYADVTVKFCIQVTGSLHPLNADSSRISVKIQMQCDSR